MGNIPSCHKLENSAVIRKMAFKSPDSLAGTYLNHDINGIPFFVNILVKNKLSSNDKPVGTSRTPKPSPSAKPVETGRPEESGRPQELYNSHTVCLIFIIGMLYGE